MVKEPGPSNTKVVSIATYKPEVQRNRSVLALWLAVLVVLVLWPIVFGEKFYIHIATLVLLYTIGASSFHLILRTGQLSMGHAAFLGLGSYASVLTMMKLQWPYPVALLAAAIVPAAFALVIGPVILRLKGTYFVLVTFALGEVVRLVFVNTIKLTGGSNGIYNIPAPYPSLAKNPTYYYYVALVAAALAVGFVNRLLRSEVGRAFDAVREGDSLAESTGVPVLRVKVLAFVIAAAMVGVQGSLVAHYIRYISPLSFTFGDSLMYVVINVVGGINTLAGAVIGTIFLVPLPEFLRSMVEYQWVLYGVILIVIMAFAPGGLVQVWNDLRRRYGRSPKGEQG